MTIKYNMSLERKLDKKRLLNAAVKSTRALTLELYTECQNTSPYDTGKLQESHSWGIDGIQSQLHAYVKVGAHYWSYVEFGTSKMSPRHWIRNSITTVQPIPTFRKYFMSSFTGG